MRDLFQCLDFDLLTTGLAQTPKVIFNMIQNIDSILSFLNIKHILVASGKFTACLETIILLPKNHLFLTFIFQCWEEKHITLLIQTFWLIAEIKGGKGRGDGEVRSH